MKENITFLILHYECIEDTINCCRSIQELESPITKNIVIVDNGSVKEPIEEEKLSDIESNLFLIKSEKNLGFAQGNNLGFKFIKDNLNSKFIIMTNADTIFPQKNFINRLILDYDQTCFDVAGPNIISLIDKLPQNPLPYRMLTSDQVKTRILKNSILNFFSYFNLDTMISKIYKVRKDSTYRVGENLLNSSSNEDIVLHGSCMIFSEKFISHQDGLYPGTFMYGEEDILAFQCKIEGKKYLYLDNLTVYHKEGSSTDVVLSGVKKRRFRYLNINKSYKKLLRMMNEYEKQKIK